MVGADVVGSGRPRQDEDRDNEAQEFGHSASSTAGWCVIERRVVE